MKTSPRGIVALASHEGIVPGPYLDSRGVWTFGIGHTANAGGIDPAKLRRGMPSDLDAAVRLAVRTFAEDLPKYEARVNAAVRVPLAQHEFDGLVSFDYNTGGIYSAQLTRALNAGDRAGAAAGFMGWLKNPELKGRRTAEQTLFRSGTYHAGRLTVWQVNAAGRVIWKPVRTLAAAELLAMLDQDPVQAWLAAAPAPIERIKAWLQAAPEGAEL